MQREPGKRDYGTSDCAALRSLASRGVNVPQAAPQQPARPAQRPSARQQPKRQRSVSTP
ncbi:hypothetical protein KPL74_18170 [Bacillus sp. NP157]|nr:hypothetical protein KPL74_18170 [Bacillus sp. NP157]